MLSQSIVQMLDEATQIVDFFNKWDEQKRVKRDIKRVIIANFNESMVKPVSERFMELAKVVRLMEGFEFQVEVKRTDRRKSASISRGRHCSSRRPTVSIR